MTKPLGYVLYWTVNKNISVKFSRLDRIIDARLIPSKLILNYRNIQLLLFKVVSEVFRAIPLKSKGVYFTKELPLQLINELNNIDGIMIYYLALSDSKQNSYQLADSCLDHFEIKITKLENQINFVLTRMNHKGTSNRYNDKLVILMGLIDNYQDILKDMYLPLVNKILDIQDRLGGPAKLVRKIRRVKVN